MFSRFMPVLAFVLLVASVPAQEFRGTILGRIADPSGAPAAGLGTGRFVNWQKGSASWSLASFLTVNFATLRQA